MDWSRTRRVWGVGSSVTNPAAAVQIGTVRLIPLVHSFHFLLSPPRCGILLLKLNSLIFLVIALHFFNNVCVILQRDFMSALNPVFKFPREAYAVSVECSSPNGKRLLSRLYYPLSDLAGRIYSHSASNCRSFHHFSR